MKKVTLYQVTKSDHMVSGDCLELRQYSYDQITPIRDSDGEFLIQNPYAEVINLPIQKYLFCQKNWKTGEVDEEIVYAAFDNELLTLIQCERNKLENLNNELVCKQAIIDDLKQNILRLEDKAVKLNTELAKYKQMGFFKRLSYLFKGKV